MKQGNDEHCDEVRIKRTELLNLMRMKDSEGRPLFEMRYCKDEGVIPLFDGKRIRFY